MDCIIIFFMIFFTLISSFSIISNTMEPLELNFNMLQEVNKPKSIHQKKYSELVSENWEYFSVFNKKYTKIPPRFDYGSVKKTSSLSYCVYDLQIREILPNFDYQKVCK